MIDFKNIIAKAISKVVNIDENEIEMSIEKPKGADNGDYAFPCFRLAKVLRKAPAKRTASSSKSGRPKRRVPKAELGSHGSFFLKIIRTLIRA